MGGTPVLSRIQCKLMSKVGVEGGSDSTLSEVVRGKRPLLFSFWYKTKTKYWLLTWFVQSFER